MTKNDWGEFKDLMGKIGGIYGKDEKAFSQIYFEALSKYHILTVKEAVKRHCYGGSQESVFYPKPANLIMNCNQIIGEEKAAKERLEQIRQQKLTSEEPELSKIELATNRFCLSLAMTRKPKYNLDIVEKLGGWSSIKKKYDEIKDCPEMLEWLREQCKIMEIV